MLKLKIDKKNQIIIEHLANNAREPISNIARKIKLTKSSTMNRLNNLIKIGIITGFVPIIDFNCLGYLIKVIFLKIELSNKTILELEKLDFYLGISKTSSFYNVIITILSKDLKDFKDQLSRIYTITGYSDIKVFSVIEYDTPAYNLFNIKIENKYIKPMQKIKLDKTDIHILKHLEKNVRTPSAKIADSLKLDSKTIINRIKKMENTQIIKTYHTTFNAVILGFHPYNIVFKIKNKNYVSKVYDYIKNYSLCYLIIQLDGEYDIIGTFILNTEKIKEFLDSLNQNFKAIWIETEIIMLFDFKSRFLPEKVIKDYT